MALEKLRLINLASLDSYISDKDVFTRSHIKLIHVVQLTQVKERKN